MIEIKLKKDEVQVVEEAIDSLDYPYDIELTETNWTQFLTIPEKGDELDDFLRILKDYDDIAAVKLAARIRKRLEKEG
jgi:hypothetical protein